MKSVDIVLDRLYSEFLNNDFNKTFFKPDMKFTNSVKIDINEDDKRNIGIIKVSHYKLSPIENSFITHIKRTINIFGDSNKPIITYLNRHRGYRKYIRWLDNTFINHNDGVFEQYFLSDYLITTSNLEYKKTKVIDMISRTIKPNENYGTFSIFGNESLMKPFIHKTYNEVDYYVYSRNILNLKLNKKILSRKNRDIESYKSKTDIENIYSSLVLSLTEIIPLNNFKSNETPMSLYKYKIKVKDIPTFINYHLYMTFLYLFGSHGEKELIFYIHTTDNSASVVNIKKVIRTSIIDILLSLMEDTNE